MKKLKNEAPANIATRYNLSERELEVLKYVVKGYTNREIGNKLFVTPHTIKAHVSKLLEKFDVNSRVSLSVKVTKDCFIHNDDFLDNY